ncbi:MULTISPECIES: OmpA/MotB family protein [unclassified Zunongwangia]|uniref:OmpA/MotB family protein n=1 Tax=unclassified Zunongwangia TaxID=2632541 RepID=UPI0022DD3D43|nr:MULTISPECIES: OmpA family protein [unclassified Zunongwangia]WBL23976.1 OmpA family protein [Zunongwangia sp. HRR-M8]WBL27396.1 OmpA family protein [Zunongwangia sp. HGR-M22]
MRKTLAVSIFSTALLASCVSKKKYVALEGELNDTKTTLQKTRVEKEEIEDKYAAIEERVADYNAKINSLRSSNDEKLELNDVTAMSNKTKEQMRKTIAKMDASQLEGVETIEDSINAAISYNLKSQITEGKDGDDVDITVDKTVVMINVSDKLLFRSGSYRLSRDAQPLLKKLAEVINSEPAMEVMVEGHTDDRTMVEDSWLEDNWDLSVRRATAVVRQLQDKYNVDGSKLIAAGRSSYSPLVENTSKENMSKNRRTRIVVIPNLDKFFAMLDSEGEI